MIHLTRAVKSSDGTIQLERWELADDQVALAASLADQDSKGQVMEGVVISQADALHLAQQGAQRGHVTLSDGREINLEGAWRVPNLVAGGPTGQNQTVQKLTLRLRRLLQKLGIHAAKPAPARRSGQPQTTEAA